LLFIGHWPLATGFRLLAESQKLIASSHLPVDSPAKTSYALLRGGSMNIFKNVGLWLQRQWMKYWYGTDTDLHTWIDFMMKSIASIQGGVIYFRLNRHASCIQCYLSLSGHCGDCDQDFGLFRLIHQRGWNRLWPIIAEQANAFANQISLDESQREARVFSTPKKSREDVRDSEQPYIVALRIADSIEALMVKIRLVNWSADEGSCDCGPCHVD
jgi:hypothetical protein